MIFAIQKETSEVFYKKRVFLKTLQKSQENTCARVSFPIKLQVSCNFIKNEALVQVFSCGFCEIFKNTFFTEDLWTTVHTFKRAHTFKHFSVHTFTKEKNKLIKIGFWLSYKGPGF